MLTVEDYGAHEARTPGQPVRAKPAVRHILGLEPLRTVPCVPSEVGVRTELIAPYPPSDGAAPFLIETDSISLIGSTTQESMTPIK